ncbi:MAG: ATP-binding protein [Myxococcales bacterium]|nr:ATP-binding protein [Myxococcales bacterium]
MRARDFYGLRFWREHPGTNAQMLSPLFKGIKFLQKDGFYYSVREGFTLTIKPPADSYNAIYEWLGLSARDYPDQTARSTPTLGQHDAVPSSQRDLPHDLAEPQRTDAAHAGEVYGQASVSGQLHFRQTGLQRIFTGKLAPTDPEVFGRKRELRLLDEAWEDPRRNVVSITDIGGAGKSALINRWLNERSDGYGGATNVLAWSFTKQGGLGKGGTAEDDFFQYAWQEFFKETSPLSASPQVQAARLAERFQQERSLLILDGVESLLDRYGHFYNPAYAVLLQQLAVDMKGGLCIVLSRPPFDALRNRGNESVLRIDSLELPPAGGIELLRNLGVRGHVAKLEQAVLDYKGHALALTLLGTLLVSQFDGQIHHRAKIRLTEEELLHGDHVRAMIRSHDKALTEPGRALFRLLSLYDRPAPWSSVVALVSASPSLGITDRELGTLVFKLLPTRLLVDNRSAHRTLELHPLVRDYFSEDFSEKDPAAFRMGHGLLFDYFCATTADHPKTVSALQPLYQAIWHGCKAGRHEEALRDVFLARVRRNSEHYSLEKLGAVGCDVSALACFFEQAWTKPAHELSSHHKYIVLSEAGIVLKTTGRTADAVAATTTALALCEAAQDWGNAGSELSDLSSIKRQSNLAEALRLIELSIEYRRRGNDTLRSLATASGRALTIHLMGRTSEAGIEFERIRDNLVQLGLPEGLTDPAAKIEIPVGCSIIVYRICQHWLDMGQAQRAFDLATQWLPQAVARRKRLSIALQHLTLARASQGLGNIQDAGQYFDQAIEHLFESGREDQLLKGLLYRAEYFLFCGDSKKAYEDIKMVGQFQEFEDYGLIQCDTLLLLARLADREGNHMLARRYRTDAADLAERTGYLLRENERSRAI